MSRALAVLVVWVVAVAAGPGCSEQAPAAERVRPVLLTQVVPGSGVESTVFAGEVRPRHESDLAFRIGGKIIARTVDAGARVTRDQVLARLDPADLTLQAESARAQLEAARVDYEFAQAEFERYASLHRQKVISASQLDARQNAMKASRAKYEQAQASLAVTRNQATYATLLAPDDGVITGVIAEVGQVVAAGQTVLRHARENEREVAIAVPEARIADLTAAEEIQVSLAADPDTTYRGKVRETSPGVDPVTRTFAVRVSVLDPAPTMQWGMTARVALVEPATTTASLLPATALAQAEDGRPAVWVYDPPAGMVSLRPVGVRQYREDGVVIAAGLAAGEWVVTTGANKLYEGQRVRPYVAGGRAAPPRTAEPGAGLAGWP